eukprot:gene9082-14256_t
MDTILIRPVSKKKDSDEYRRQVALDTLALQNDDIDIDAYTDGSVLNPRSLGRGGGGYVCIDA